MNEITNKKHGGKRTGAGRKPRYLFPKQQKTIRLPSDWINQLIDEYGSFQVAIEILAKTHLNK